MNGFTHLHVHTQYSLLDGAARIPELVAKAKELGMDALAVTDHGAMYGVVDFYKACKKAGIKPILGMEAYVAPGSYKAKESAREYAHLILLAKNEQGYKNLMKLSSIAFIEGFYYKPRIDYDLLEQYRDGLICLSACLAGDIPQLLLAGRYDAAKQLAQRLKTMFGGDFYIELQNHGLPEQLEILPKLNQIAKELGILTVATNDIHYVDKADAESQDVLLCIQTNKAVSDPNRMKMSTDEFYLKSQEEMLQALSDYPEAVGNTAAVAEKCSVELRFGEQHLPKFMAPGGLTNEAYLLELCEAGLRHKMPGAGPEAWERLYHEAEVIKQMNFTDYFLIVWDFVNFAHENGIFVGPGRGSGAGSLVAYAMDITDIDPVKHELIFERFLNPERISMPDFDIDFCIERRQEVIDYVIRRYGADHVSQIITFGSMAAKAAIRDVGRALDMPYADVDKIAKLVPNVLGITLSRALEMSAELRELTNVNPQVKKLIDLSLKLEGLPRHASTHAAGVVISAQPIVECVPLQRNEDAITTQFPKDTVEELGLLKMDFLGLRTLTVIRDTLEYIRQDNKAVPDLEHMEYDDPAVFHMIAEGDTDGVFQLESSGMRQFFMQLKPGNFEDIIAGIALFRPGPMEQIPRYLAGKNSQKKIQYAHEKLRSILDKTYGCMVYQEQVMQIVRDLAGYSWGRSDLVRRAMSKKKHEVMAKEREYFIDGIVENGEVIVPGAVRNGVSKEVANRIFDEMMDFASYAFNKSHAAAYAVVAYRTAYLKLYYPVEFMTALINSFIGAGTDKIAEYIYFCKQKGIKILPPDINQSQGKFSVENGGIRFGLVAIRNVGEAQIQEMVAEREANGPFRDFYDFARRNENIKKRIAEGLIKAGCFDGMGVKRAQLIAAHEQIIDAAASERKQRAQGQLSLFDLGGGADSQPSAHITLPQMVEFDENVLLSMEREVMGIYISGHPLFEYSKALGALGTSSAILLAADGTGEYKDNQIVRIGGIITNIKTKPTKSGNGLMAYATLEDLSGSMELTVFPSVYMKYRSSLIVDNIVSVSGKLNMREDQNNTVLVDGVQPLKPDAPGEKREAAETEQKKAKPDAPGKTPGGTETQQKSAKTDVPVEMREVLVAEQRPERQVEAGGKRLYLKLDTTNRDLVEQLKTMFRRFPGNIPIVLCDNSTGKKMLADRELYINPSGALLDAAREILGEENVKY